MNSETQRPLVQGNEPKEKQSLGEFTHETEQKITDNLFKPYKPEDKASLDFLHDVEYGLALSKAAGELFQKLAFEYAESERDYNGQAPEGELEGWALRVEQMEVTHPHFSKDVLEKAKEYNRGKPYELKPMKITELPNESYLLQSSMQRFQQAQGQNIIEEYVVNGLFSEYNTAQAEIIIADPQTKTMLEINSLLPEGVILSPSDLVKNKFIKFKEPIILKGEKIDEIDSVKEVSIPVDLKDYKGSQDASNELHGHFSLSKFKDGGGGRIQYGNLGSPGGFLCLLHEIGHSWQEKFRRIGNRKNYKDYINLAGFELWSLALTLKHKKQTEVDQEQYDKQIVEPKIEELKSMGMDVNLESFQDSSRELEPGEFRIKSVIGEGWFIIRSSKLEGLIKAYVSEEKEPWENAVKILEFLRENGIDLEPGLKTNSQINEFISTALATYQKDLEADMQAGTKIDSFIE